MHSSTRRKRDTRRSSWASQGVAGMAVSAVVASGGDGGVRAGRTEEGESVRGERERAGRLWGSRGIVQTRRGGARQAGWEEVAAACSCARRARALAYWREEEGDRRAPGGLGRQLGRRGGLQQVQ